MIFLIHWKTHEVSTKGPLTFSILNHLYLNDYAEFDSKISYIMFLHEYLLACEISTETTLALSSYVTKECFSVTDRDADSDTIFTIVVMTFCF